MVDGLRNKPYELRLITEAKVNYTAKTETARRFNRNVQDPGQSCKRRSQIQIQITEIGINPSVSQQFQKSTGSMRRVGHLNFKAPASSARYL